MSDDRALLESAAKAAGVEWTRFDPLPAEFDKEDGRVYRQWGLLVGVTSSMLEGFEGRYWNPLVDDGDALRLAVRLQLTVHNEHLNAGAAYCTNASDDTFETVWSGTNEDDLIPADYAATRRAIVLAAAEIGKMVGAPLARAD